MEEILIIDDSQQICQMLAEFVLPELGYRTAIANTGRQGLNRLRQRLPDLILLDLQLPDISGLDLLRLIAQERFDVPVILMTAHGSEGIAVEAFRLGARNYLIKPFSETEAQAVIDQALRERRLRRDKDQLTRNLQQRVQELTVLYAIGKSVSSMLDQEELLVRIVEAGVYITRAEEGFLLLRDPRADELYLRAAKNIGEARVQRMRMPIEDTLAGQVVRTGKPVRLDGTTQGAVLKVKTGFLVRSILQVPLIVGSEVIGVLAVDNQQADRTFTDNDQLQLSALADYAAVAIENARLYEESRRSEARYRELFANATDSIFILDRQLRIQSINRVGAAAIGYPEQDLLSRPLRELSDADRWEEAESWFASLLMGNLAQPFELKMIHQQGQGVIFEVNARLIRETGSPDSIHCIARDLTERRRLEAQLLQSEKLSGIGQLVAGVAHELNNPLTSISGFTQLLLRKPTFEAEVVSDLKHIHLQAERAARIVQNLLLFAREHKPERRLINLNDVMQDTMALRAYQLRVDNIRVTKAFDPNLPQTVADPWQLQQVILNLINNAHHAITDKGEPGILTLRTFVGKPTQPDIVVAENVVTLAITDTGVGIPPHVMSSIFDPFYTTKPVGQGTGLGLSICFGIVREHGGRIWAESEVGVGTTMYVELPLTQTLAQNGVHSPEPNPDQSRTKQTKARVLVVDDEEPVSNLLSRLLRELGHEPHVANGGEEALALIDKQRFDLILSDVKMPGMSGFELHQRIRTIDDTLARSVVFITGDVMSAATQARLAQIGNPYLAKPFSIEKLETLVQSMLLQQMQTDDEESA
jgi:two-component system NtrC family sensor kinase